jgi:hypothetical protein
MDGTSKDKKYRGILIRNATKQYAEDQYPAIVVGLSTKKLMVSTQPSPIGLHVVNVFDGLGFQIEIPLSDYQKIISVVDKLGKLPLFKSDYSLSYSMAKAEIGAIF